MDDFQRHLENANQIATLLGYLAPRMEPKKTTALLEYLGDLINPLVAIFLKPHFILMKDKELPPGMQALRERLAALDLDIENDLAVKSMEVTEPVSLKPEVNDFIRDTVFGATPVDKAVNALLTDCSDPDTYVRFNAQSTLPFDLKFLPRLAVSRATVFLRAAEQISPKDHLLHYYLANILCQGYLKLSHFEGCFEESVRILQQPIPLKNEYQSYLQILKGVALAGLGELTQAKEALTTSQDLAMKDRSTDTSSLCLALSEAFRLGLSTGDFAGLSEKGDLLATSLDQCQEINARYTAISFLAIWQSNLFEQQVADENSQFAVESARESRALDIEIDVRNQRARLLLMQGRKEEAAHSLVENLPLLALSENALVGAQTQALIYQTTSREIPQLPESLPANWSAFLPNVHTLPLVDSIHIVTGEARQRAFTDRVNAAQHLVPAVRACEEIRQLIPGGQIESFLETFIEVYRLYVDLPTHEHMTTEEHTSILHTLITFFEDAGARQDEYLARASLQRHYERSDQRSTSDSELISEISRDIGHHTWIVGESIEDRYVVQQILTSGGMAVVYIVHDKKRPMRLAVKSLRPELPLSLQGVRRFLSEANIWAHLGEHPHIVQVMSVSRFSDSSPLIFLEFVEGETLRELFRKAGGYLPLLHVLDFAIQCCGGMQYVHKKGVIHRDLKPDNLLITREGILKITDFGISRAFLEDYRSDETENAKPLKARLTSFGVALGTVPYMSPEQLSGDPNIGSASDIFSFGVVLYELLTGILPFSGETPSEIISSQKSRPRVPSAFFADRSFPTELDDLVMQCLATDPYARPSNFGMLEKALIAVYESVNPVESERTLRLQQSIQLLNQRKWRDAITLLDEVLRKDPRDVDAWHNKGNALMYLNEQFELDFASGADPDWRPDQLKMTESTRSAIRCAERAIELYPAHDWAWNTKGGCLIRIGYFHKALLCLNKAITINNGYAVAWRNRSTCLRRLGRLDEALGSYQFALALEPRNPDALNGLGVCLALLNRYDEALASFAEALTIAPHHIQATGNQKLWKSIAEGDRDIVVAVPSYDPVLAKHLEKFFDLPTTGDRPGRAPRDLEADELGNRAWGLLNIGLLADALNVVNQALEIDSEYSTLLLHKGRILRRMGRLEEAVEVFSSALEIDPGYYLVRLNRGPALVSLGRYEEAISDYRTYLEKEPEDAAAWMNLGYCYTQQGDLKSALENFDKAVQIDPDHYLGLIGKSQAHLLLGELDKADEYCRKALASDPINADAWLLSGQIAQQRSNMNEALKAYARVTEIAPTNPHGWTLGACCMNLLGWSTDIVIEWCERAQVLKGANHRLLAVTRAHALYRREHYREALEIYDSLLLSEPDDEALQNLRELCLRELNKQI